MKRFSLFMIGILWSLQVFAELLYFEWNRPLQRENGTTLEREEISHYEIQGKTQAGVVVFEKPIPNRFATSIITDNPNHLQVAEYVIAVSDTTGLYSEFVPIQPKPFQLEHLIPPAVKGFKAMTRP